MNTTPTISRRPTQAQGDDEVLPVFVYGTLRRGQANHNLIGREALLILPGLAPDLALYAPGLPYVASAPGSVVVGEVVFLAPESYRRTLSRLDRLEGFTGSGCENHYDRVARTVHLMDGTVLTAWVYQAGALGGTRLAESCRVASGDWLERGGRR
jgi:gamma-glutamylcyclotransferase (GGCT)/AIG2-like uncharacterized protein YtfP